MSLHSAKTQVIIIITISPSSLLPPPPSPQRENLRCDKTRLYLKTTNACVQAKAVYKFNFYYTGSNTYLILKNDLPASK
jgi:hypothetical protein